MAIEIHRNALSARFAAAAANVRLSRRASARKNPDLCPLVQYRTSTTC